MPTPRTRESNSPIEADVLHGVAFLFANTGLFFHRSGRGFGRGRGLGGCGGRGSWIAEARSLCDPERPTHMQDEKVIRPLSLPRLDLRYLARAAVCSIAIGGHAGGTLERANEVCLLGVPEFSRDLA